MHPLCVRLVPAGYAGMAENAYQNDGEAQHSENDQDSGGDVERSPCLRRHVPPSATNLDRQKCLSGPSTDVVLIR